MEAPEITTTASTVSHETATAILAELEGAWNAADGAAFGRPFATPTDFVDVSGALHQGQSGAAIGAAHQGIFDTIYKGSQVSYHLIQAVHIDENTVLAHAGAELQAPAGPLAGTNQSTITMVLQQADGRWQIRAFQNTLVMKRGG